MNQQKIDELEEELISKGYTVKREVMFDEYRDGYSGHKSRRFADIVAYAGEKIIAIFQVGKVNQNGLPVSRESKAIEDIMNASQYDGQPITFVPYNNDDLGFLEYLF